MKEQIARPPFQSALPFGDTAATEADSTVLEQNLLRQRPIGSGERRAGTELRTSSTCWRIWI